MSCVNINSAEYKDLVKGLPDNQEFVARAVISKFQTENKTDKLPDFIELKSMMADLYNTNKAGVDYTDFYSDVRNMFKTLIPSLTDKDLDERVKFIDKLELMRLRNGKDVLSTFINNTVYIANSLPTERGEKAYTDVRHEIFHTIFNNFLNTKEQEKIMESFKRWKPEFASVMDKEELEERMADTFEAYRLNPKKTIPILIRDLFQSILKFFGLLGDNYNDIQRLFNDVEQGKFTRDYIKDSLVTRDKTILSKYTEFQTDLDLFLQSKAFVLNNLNELMFPSDNKNLSEQINNELFLKQDYRSPLFQNNKEVFKLGLTKNDALKLLQKRIKTLKDSRIQDPQLSKVINTLSKRYILKDLYDYLQPYSLAEVGQDGELKLKSQIEEDQTISLIESDEEINSLEIGSKELINPTTKISEVVKDFLSSITYETTPGNVVNIDPGAGFIALLNMLGSLYGNTSLEDNLQSLRDNYNSTVKGNQTKAVYNKLKSLHESVISNNRVSLNIKGVSEEEIKSLKLKLDAVNISYEEFKGVMNIVIPENIKIENKGSNSVDNVVVFSLNNRANNGKSYLIEQKPTESNKTFVEKVANETDIPSFIISKLFKYNEERNQVAELTKVANSLRKLSPKFVKITTSKVVDEDSGMTGSATSYAFINKVSDYKSSGSLSSIVRDRLDILPLRKSVVAAVDTYKPIKDKGDKKQLRSLLEDIVVNKLNAVSISDFQRVSDKDVINLLNNLERVVNFVPEIRTTKQTEEFNESDAYLRHTSNFANLLTKYTFEKNNPTSFSVSTSNKQKWENVMSNTSYKVFKNLEEFALGTIKSEKLIPYFKNSFKNYLKYNPLLEHNYSNGEMNVNQSLLKVGDDDFYSDHQETYFENRSQAYEKTPVPFHKETPRDWINRNFLAMFQLPILESMSGNKKTEKSGLSYFQQKFQPESAPNVSVIKMGVNTAEQLQENIHNMILQEAYMNLLNTGSNRGNLIKNTKKSLLPGLEGSAYFLKDGNNIFFDGAGNLYKEFGTVVNGKLQINKDNKVLRGLEDTIMKNIDSSLTQFVDLAVTERATLDGSLMAEMYSKIKNSYPRAYQLSDNELNTLKNISIDARTDVESLKASESFETEKEVLKKALSTYYLNSYVNGFFMNQLSSGSTQNYKNPLDEIKRQAGVNAMNDTGLIDNQHGMRSTYKNVVIKAANNFYGQSHKFAKVPLLQRFFRNKKQEVGDAQSWDIPEYKTMLKKSFGKSVDMGIVTKDVHFEVNENGGVDYRKTSSAELTNEVVKKNKTLRDLRFELTFGPMLSTWGPDKFDEDSPRVKELYDKLVDNNGLKDVNEYMEYQDFLKEAEDTMIHKASFESAIKGSKPSRMSSFIKNKKTGTFDFNLEDSSILTLNSSFNGIQQAIRHRYIDAFISHFTQLTYLIGLNRTDTSIKNNKTITRTLSKFAKAGMFDTLFDYRMSYGDDKTLKANNRSKKEFIQDLIKKLDLPGNERIVSMLNTKVNGKSISMNNPLFSEKLMQSFFNSFTKKTVSPKHPGGSFVLQSEFGFEASNVLNQNSLRTPEVVIQDGKILYAECYLPEMYSDQLKTGELVYYNSDQYNKMFGFRIPSSDLHSSVPLKVIGYYPSSSHDNVIVIPSAVTALHGSDFDVDKLFVVRYGVFGVSDEDKDPKTPNQEIDETSNKREYKTKFQGDNKIIAQKGIKFGYTAPNANYDTRNNLIDFGTDNLHTQIFNVDSILLGEKKKTQDRILKLEQEAEGANKFQQSEMRTEVRGLTEHLKVLRSIQKGLYSNQILDSVMDNISYSGENAEDILFGITFDPVKGYEEESEYSELARVFSDINQTDKNKIGLKDKIIWGHPTIGKSYLKKKGEDRFITLDDDYADEVNSFVDANRGKQTRQEYKGSKPKEYNEFMLSLFDRLKEQAKQENKQLFVSNTNILKERMSEFDKVINMSKTEFKKRFDERGATYGFEDWKSDIDETISSVPANKVINSDDYLSDLFSDTLPKRPTLYKSINEIDTDIRTEIEKELSEKLGVDITTEEGQQDILNLANDELKDDWVEQRDEFIRRQRGAGSVNINKVEQHVNMHKETYMAAGLVGLIANFSKGLAYAFHGITDSSKDIELDIPEKDVISLDGQKFNKLALTNKDGIKTQEIRSLALNAAIDHVKEQILNVLNVGNKTAKIFLAGVSTEMNLHQTSMLLLQPVAKELNSSNATTVSATINKMKAAILEKFKDNNPFTQTEIDELNVSTKDLEKHITKNFSDMLKDGERKELLLQYKVMDQLTVLNAIGEEVSAVSGALSIIQGLPYNLEAAYTKLADINKFINIEKFYNKLENTEKSEYTEKGFKDDLKGAKTMFKNVNLATNENVLAALEAIKTQIDVASEMFAENSVQAQFLVNNMIKAVSNNSDPSTMFTGENDENLTFDTVKTMTINDKYLKGRNTFNMFKMISRNIFNYLTSGLNIPYNNDAHVFSLGIQNQTLTTIKKDDKEYQLGTVKSYLNSFLMKEGEVYDSTKNYDGNNFVVSQVNPQWRLKPLAIIKKQNPDNKFLKGVGIDTNFRDKVRVMTFNSSLVNTAENLAEIEQAVNQLNGLNNIYVRLDKKDRWVDVPASLHPETIEMNEVVFNILKSSLYTDKFKFSSSKATNVIPPQYYQKIFQSLDTLTRDLILWNNGSNGNKYYKDFSDLENEDNQRSALSDIKENLFINTIFSIPTVLPNLKSMLPNTKDRFKMLNRQSGILNNGNIYDLYFDANILDKTLVPDVLTGETTQSTEKTTENTNIEVDQDLSESQAENDLFEKFRKNPSFITDESYDRPGSFTIFMKVGATGSKDTNDLKYYYKRIGVVNGKLTNNSFDLNLLINKYMIKDYYNPKRFAIPVRDADFSGERVSLKNISVSSFLIASSDDQRTKVQNKEEIKQSQDQQFELLRAKPENKFKTDDQIRSEIKTKINIENVINQVNEVSLYDSRNLDRVGIRNFKILSKTLSPDKNKIDFELEALPKTQQIGFKQFSSPLVMLNTLRNTTNTVADKAAISTENQDKQIKQAEEVLNKKKKNCN